MTTFRTPLTLDILGAAPAAPAVTKVKAFMLVDGLYVLDSAGNLIKIGPSRRFLMADMVQFQFELETNGNYVCDFTQLSNEDSTAIGYQSIWNNLGVTGTLSTALADGAYRIYVIGDLTGATIDVVTSPFLAPFVPPVATPFFTWVSVAYIQAGVWRAMEQRGKWVSPGSANVLVSAQSPIVPTPVTSFWLPPYLIEEAVLVITTDSGTLPPNASTFTLLTTPGSARTIARSSLYIQTDTKRRLFQDTVTVPFLQDVVGATPQTDAFNYQVDAATTSTTIQLIAFKMSL